MERRRTRVVAGGAAAATTAVVAGWAAPAHAGTPAPTVQAVCVVDAGEPDGSNRVSGRLQGFAANQDYNSLIVMKGERNGRTFNFVIDFNTPTGSDGGYETPGGPENGVPYSSLPVDVGWILYRDRNDNDSFDRNADEIVFEGNGDVTACPQTVTLSSK
jgi:hypothetical protein